MQAYSIGYGNISCTQKSSGSQIGIYHGNKLKNVKCQMSKNIYRRRRMSRVRIGGAGGRRNVIRLSRMQQRTVLFSDVPLMW